ncbi:MAG: ribosomal protein S18-alanine N-acetyltransferase [Lachnospiraceae bacterium]|nr:ribosomal protein S18-alanine N-acetyltransferase [Lachnospiraceae bacterium]
MSFRIRPAGERDLVKILRIEKECFTDPWSINVFRGAMSEPHTSVFVLVDDSEEIAGYSVSDVVLDEGALDNLAVTAEKRGQGAGAMLLQNALEDARNKGVKRFFLEVRKSNEKALKLYEKAGFTRLSVRKAYYQDPVEDAIVMELRC